MSQDLVRTIYLSNAVALMDSAALSVLLETCVEKNRTCGITGLLVYSDGNFMQVLEGARPDVNETFERISQDSRHHQIMRMIDEPIDARHFESWAMGFRDDSALNDEQRAAFSEITGIANATGDSYATLPSSVRAFIGMLIPRASL